MRKPWAGVDRRASGLVEYVCEHNTGHPAPGSVHWLHINGIHGKGVHGCDGCCRDPKWQLAAAIESYKIANKLLKAAKLELKRERNKKRSA